MDNTLIAKEEMEITGKIEKISWLKPHRSPFVCLMRLKDV